MMINTRESHVMGLKSDGSLWAWGLNDQAQLGDGTTTDQLQPVAVGTGTSWTSISTGFNYSLCMHADRYLYCGTGANDKGQLGNSTRDQAINFVCVPGVPCADIDGDGVLKFSDVSLLLEKLKQNCEKCAEDINKDGTVGVADLNVLIQQFGQACK